jgi:hypothetical protein
MRYSGATAKTQEDEELRKAADELIYFFKNIDLPEVDLGKFKGSNVRDFASSICSGKNYLQSSQASSILFGGPLSDPTNSGSQPSGFDSPERRESRKSF